MPKPEDITAIADLECIPEEMVPDIVTLLHTVTLEKNEKPIIFHTSMYDRGSSSESCGHFVAFTNNEFRSYQDVDSLSEVQFGEISHIIEANIRGARQLFFKIEVTPVVGYKYGGIWFTKKVDAPTRIMVKSTSVSQPLITRLENGNRVAVLNPKIRVPSLEASVLLRHQGAPQGGL